MCFFCAGLLDAAVGGFRNCLDIAAHLTEGPSLGNVRC
jgi:hypothetical protein